MNTSITAVLAYLNRMQRERDAMIAALETALEYFEDRQDADHDQDGYIPNKEMQIASEINQALDIAGVE